MLTSQTESTASTQPLLPRKAHSQYRKPDTLDITLPSLCDQQLFNYYKQVANSSLYYWNQQQASSSASPIPENAFHLFFECSFSSAIWTEIRAWCGISRKYNNPTREWKWIIERLQGSITKSVLFLEMTAVEKGLELAKEMGIKKIMVQTDSKQVSRILNEEVTPTWRVE
ncbi:hypothetical protein FRX31_028354, partial [Thalictrum thalictroides]